ncbi:MULTISPECIES: hypothetical protein [Aliarcobacter]|uniref:hypothetical protein n=1 Tax=Aliarcobacter TaxID=2321111 RepID=UPI0021B2A04C|nr:MULTISPECIES: hypothetical protein [Aliarcobacter]MCT7512574.1 hypothetical protein [Aliarcobacter cryaerophilus]MCT7635872.1 hypothetical protein [Aliarcobacter butzleri]
MRTAKILVQKTIIGLSEDNKAKLQSLEIYKDKKHFQFSNGWVDLAYELGKNIEEVCKLVNCELPKIEAMYNKYNSLRVDYHFNLPVPKIIETLIDSLIYVTEDKSEIICEYCGTSYEIEEIENNHYINACEKCLNRKNKKG